MTTSLDIGTMSDYRKAQQDIVWLDASAATKGSFLKSALVIGSGGIARRHCENIGVFLLTSHDKLSFPSSQTAASFQNVDHVVSRLPDIECAQFDFAVVASPASCTLSTPEHLVRNNVQF